MQAIATAPQIIMSGTIVNRVSELAGKRRMQISDLSRAAGIHYDTAKRYWYGDAEGITWDTLAKLCDALDCTVGDLFEFTDSENGNR